MTGQITDPPVEMPAPTYWIGICDTCRAVKTFATERARELWEKYHPHEEDE